MPRLPTTNRPNSQKGTERGRSARPRSDVGPGHRAFPISRAELARRASKARSTITELLQGPLKPACSGGGRVDAAHPVLAAYAREVWGMDPSTLTYRNDTQPLSSSLGTVAARVPPTHISFAEFASLAGVTERLIAHAAESGSMAGAVFGRRIDLRSGAALAFLVERPLPVSADGTVDTSALPDECFADRDSPLAVACFVRLYGYAHEAHT